MAVPVYVSPGQPITSAWGNDVVATFNDLQAALNDINSRLGSRIRGGYASVTTDANGYVTVGFGTAFAAPPLIVATLTGDVSSSLVARVIIISEGGVTTSQFTARIFNSSDGGAVINTPVNVNWIATTGWLG